MAESTTPENAANSAPFVVHFQYLKDLSLENPNPLAHLTDNKDVKPEIGINVQVNARHLAERMFEVVLEINVDAKRGEDKMFLCQVQYAGLASLREGTPDDQTRPLLLEEIPAVLFPFARRIVADATQETGFPAIMLPPFNFKEMNKSQKQEAETAPTSH